MKPLLLAMLLFFSFQSFAADLQGVYKGKTYSFRFYSTEVTGSWGSESYYLRFYSSAIDGQLANKKIYLHFYSTQVRGNLACGAVSIDIYGFEMKGNMCDDEFHTIDTNTKANDVAFEMLMDELLLSLPNPARNGIRARIDEARSNNGWLE